MPPKSRKVNESEEDEQKLQAIVLTDSYQTRFMPLTSVKPRCLLPLANVPLLEYTLEFLAQSDVVSEVYLMCSSHAEQIQTYVDESKWVASSSPFKKIQTITSHESRSVGDAIRDIDARGIVTGDFILVSGDVITNLDLNKALALHKVRKANDRDYICTMVLKQGSESHRSRSYIEPSCFILDKETNRCLYYQDIPPVDGIKSSVSIDPEVLADVGEFVIKNDLIDCHVDICTPVVPTIFQENFDYQYLRKDWVKGVLTSDLLKKNIYAYITTEDYAARVESWQTYDGISQDVLERWCHPIVPERNLLEDQTYTYESQHIYKEHNIRLSQSSKLQSRVAIGADTFIGDGTIIGGSVIGRNCRIGNNVTIFNSYIWDGATIEDGCIVRHAIVAANAVVKANAMLNSGSVIGFDVVIDENVIIPNETKIVKTPIKKMADSAMLLSSSDEEGSGDDDDDDDDDDNINNDDDSDSERDDKNRINDPSVVGANGVGFLYQDEEEDDETNKGYSGIMYQMAKLNISDISVASTTVGTHQLSSKRKKRTQSTTSMYEEGEEGEEEEENFNNEAIATLERAMESNHDIDTALLELNTLRMSMNVTYHEVRQSTMNALVQRVDHFIATQTLGVKEAVDKVFGQWTPLFERQVFEDADQVDLMLILQELCCKLNKDYRSMLFLHVLVELYDKEIIEEDNIYEWWSGDKSKEMSVVRDKAEKWIEWLQQAESDDDEEED